MPYTRTTIILRTIGVMSAVASGVLLWYAFDRPFVEGVLDLRLPSWVPNFGGIRKGIQDYVVQSAGLQLGPQYLLPTIDRLIQSGDRGIGYAVYLFSVIIPIAKIAASAVACIGLQVPVRIRVGLAYFVGLLSKWSMADVFIVALLIVYFKAEGLTYSLVVRDGIYYYAGAAVASSIAGSCALMAIRIERNIPIPYSQELQ